MQIITQQTSNNHPTPQDNHSSKKAKQTLNSMYRKITGPEAQLKAIRILTAIAFVFAIISIFGSQVGFYYDFRLFTPDYSRPTAIILALALEGFRIAGILVFFSYRKKSQFHIRAIALSFVIFVTIVASIFHIRGAMSMSVVTTQDATIKVLEQKHELALARVDMAKELQKTTSEAQKYALTNGLPGDDGKTITTMAGTTKAITELFKNKKLSTIEYRFLNGQQTQAKILKKVMMIVLPMVEFFAFLSLFVAYLKTQSVSTGVKELVDTREMLEDMEDSMVAVAKEKMISDFNQKHNLGSSAPVGSPSPTPQDSPTPPIAPKAPYPALGAIGAGEKGQIWSNPSTNYPTLPTTTTKILGTENTFFKGTYDNFVNAYEGDGFAVEKFPLVPKEEENRPTPRKKREKTRIIRDGNEFKILENVSRDRGTETEFESEKISLNDFNEDFISKEEWFNMSEESRALAMSYVDLSLFDAITESTMIQIVYENGLINTYDEPLVKKTDATKQYKNLRGGTLQDARDIYVFTMEKLEKQDKIVRRSRYHNRCQGLNIGKVQQVG